MLPTGQRPIQVTAATLAVLGLVNGKGQWIVLEIEGRPIVLSIERPDAPDVDAAGEIAGPLVESLQAAGS